MGFLWLRIILLMTLVVNISIFLCLRPFWRHYTELHEALRQATVIHHVADRAISRTDVPMGPFATGRFQDSVKALRDVPSIQSLTSFSNLELAANGVMIGTTPWASLHPGIHEFQADITQRIGSYNSVVEALGSALAISQAIALVAVILGRRSRQKDHGSAE